MLLLLIALGFLAGSYIVEFFGSSWGVYAYTFSPFAGAILGAIAAYYIRKRHPRSPNIDKWLYWTLFILGIVGTVIFGIASLSPDEEPCYAFWLCDIEIFLTVISLIMLGIGLAWIISRRRKA